MQLCLQHSGSRGIAPESCRRGWLSSRPLTTGQIFLTGLEPGCAVVRDDPRLYFRHDTLDTDSCVAPGLFFVVCLTH